MPNFAFIHIHWRLSICYTAAMSNSRCLWHTQRRPAIQSETTGYFCLITLRCVWSWAPEWWQMEYILICMYCHWYQYYIWSTETWSYNSRCLICRNKSTVILEITGDINDWIFAVCEQELNSNCSLGLHWYRDQRNQVDTIVSTNDCVFNMTFER